jgi:hypothetical protein
MGTRALDEVAIDAQAPRHAARVRDRVSGRLSARKEQRLSDADWTYTLL